MAKAPLSPAEQLFLGFIAEPEEQGFIPPPPHQVGDVRMSFVGVRLAPDAVLQLLPPELTPADSCSGLICMYSAGSGWGMAPFSSCFAAVEVKGYDAPDGSSGYYIAAGYYSGRAGVLMQRYYNTNAVDGYSRHFRDGDLAVNVGGPEGEEAVVMRTRPRLQQPPPSSVVHHYLGRRPQGGTNLFPIAFSGVVGEAEPVSIEIADTASERMKLARPVELTYALETRDGALTFGMPRSITDLPDDLASESIRASLLNVFSSIGSAAILVGADGEIGLMNAGAEALLGDGVRVQGGRLRPTRATNRSALERLIANATGGTAGKVELDPIALERETGGPLIVQAVPVAAAVAGRPSALILLNDPARTTSVSPRAALQLLGLTPAEARIASVVGAGRSPREAADELQLTFHTVRSGLRIIFDKLSISRQSELAKIVQRLAG